MYLYIFEYSSTSIHEHYIDSASPEDNDDVLTNLGYYPEDCVYMWSPIQLDIIKH